MEIHTVNEVFYAIPTCGIDICTITSHSNVTVSYYYINIVHIVIRDNVPTPSAIAMKWLSQKFYHVLPKQRIQMSLILHQSFWSTPIPLQVSILQRISDTVQLEIFIIREFLQFYYWLYLEKLAIQMITQKVSLAGHTLIAGERVWKLWPRALWWLHLFAWHICNSYWPIPEVCMQYRSTNPQGKACGMSVSILHTKWGIGQ